MTPHIITAYNVDQALHDALWYLKVSGVESPSRNGPVIAAPGPVLTVYKNPTHRVLFSSYRDANPFFHFFESLWMLAGRNDVSFVEKFSPNMRNFSDDGLSLNGAYGYRWRKRWFDQISNIVEHLKKDPASRREVLTMWTSGDLLDRNSKDLPCNTHVYVDIREEKLNITVCNRSNDMWWGTYGANVVHMSFLQEFLAGAVGVEVGTYIQFSNNFHIYTEMYDGKAVIETPALVDDNLGNYPGTYPVISINWELWLEEVEVFIDRGNSKLYTEPFLNEAATPMLDCWYLYKDNRLREAVETTKFIHAPDWQLACKRWLQRRLEKRNAKRED